MDRIEYHAFNPEPFNQFLSNPEKNRIENLECILIGIGTLVVVAGIIIYVREMQKSSI